MARLLNNTLFDSIVGHRSEIDNLMRAVSEKRLHSTLLFVGPHGVGKKQVGFALAQALLCEKSPDVCGTCSHCLRVASFRHESLLLIEPQKNMIKVDQSREILDFLSLRSLGENRVVVIDQAHSLNPQAANALLKILEEPPAGTHFILTATAPQSMLPTIRSRSQIVHFKPLSGEEMRQKTRQPEWMLRASQGSFANLAMLSEEDEQQVRSQAIHHLFELGRDAQLYLRDSWKAVIRDRQEALNIARYWSSFIRDALVFQSGGTGLINVDQLDLIKHLAEFETSHLRQISEWVVRLEPALMHNFDPQLTFEDFWIRSHRILA